MILTSADDIRNLWADADDQNAAEAILGGLNQEAVSDNWTGTVSHPHSGYLFQTF